MPSGDPTWTCRFCGSMYFTNIQTKCYCRGIYDQALRNNDELLSDLMYEIEQFSDSTFGGPKDRDESYPLKKLKLELEELIQNTDDKMEWADCMLLLLDAARRKGHTPKKLFEFCLEKLEINKTRTWEKSEDGIFSHKK